LLDLNLPFTVAKQPEVAVHVLASFKNLFLVSGMGSGKSLVPTFAVLVLRKLMNMEKVVALVTVPLSAIQMKKLSETLVKSKKF
jgi:ATP-dependent helicase YprA (DUF1998 family)